jgi:hypothetical protein
MLRLNRIFDRDQAKHKDKNKSTIICLATCFEHIYSIVLKKQSFFSSGQISKKLKIDKARIVAYQFLSNFQTGGFLKKQGF